MSSPRRSPGDTIETRRQYWFALFRPVPMTDYDRELQRQSAILAALPKSKADLLPLFIGVTRIQAVRPIAPMGVVVVLAGALGLAIGIALVFFMGDEIQNLIAGTVLMAGVVGALAILCRGRLDPVWCVEDYDEARDAARRASGKEPWLNWAPNPSLLRDRKGDTK